MLVAFIVVNVIAVKIVTIAMFVHIVKNVNNVLTAEIVTIARDAYNVKNVKIVNIVLTVCMLMENSI